MLRIEEEIKKAKDGVMVTLSNIGEGIHGDYDKNDEDDVNLLRFYIYTDEGRSCDPDKGGWQEKDSWCTDLAADMPDDMLQKALDVIFDASGKPQQEQYKKHLPYSIRHTKKYNI